MPDLRLSGLVEESIVDGPGLRFVVFTQGCPHHCPGCHNPETHDPRGGHTVSTDALFARFVSNPLLAGITLSGGEPFQQPAALAELAARVHAHGKTVIIYTGYTIEQLHALAQHDRAADALLDQADMLVDGPYVERLRELDSGLHGSSNQRILDRDAIREIRSRLAGAPRTAPGNAPVHASRLESPVRNREPHSARSGIFSPAAQNYPADL